MQYQLKSIELFDLKHEIKDEKEFSKLLDYCEKSIQSKYEEILPVRLTVSGVIIVDIQE